MPVLNGEEHIGDQLAALAAQTYRGEWELVVVDNGCRDRSMEIVREWAPRLPSVTIVDATARRGLNRARNAGAAAARGDFLAFCDADDVATPGWLEAMAEAAAERRHRRRPARVGDAQRPGRPRLATRRRR